uniref:Uncharacterized protein n=1 Tax=Fopius arisanus TaxID=64838 RepID=A0A0C9R2M7_9HYME
MSSLLRLCDLYVSGNNSVANKPTIKLADKTISTTDINEAFIKNLPDFVTTDKSWILEHKDLLKHNFDFIISGVPNCNTKIPPIKSEFTRVITYDYVKFYNHDTSRKLVPRMLINLENREILPGRCVFINTGYTIKAAVSTSSTTNHKNFIILPNIVCKDTSGKNCKIIPNIYARDEDDCGLFTISFTLIEGIPSKLQVVFNCYIVGTITHNSVVLHERQPNNDIFKSKDMREERATKNLKVKTHFDSMIRNNDYVEFKTYNHLVLPPITWPKQLLKIHKKIAIITSRRREWAQDDLITLSGVCVDAKNDRTPMLFTRDNKIPSKNTHCLTIIDSKVTLHSTINNVENYYGLSLINGAFKSVFGNNFNKIQKRMKIMNDNAYKLNTHRRIIARICGEDDVASIKSWNLWNVYDASLSLDAIKLDDPRLVEHLIPEDELFKIMSIKITKDTRTLSSSLLHSMYWLIAMFCTSNLSSEALVELSTKVSITDHNKKHKIDDEDFTDEGEKIDAKKLKVTH